MAAGIKELNEEKPENVIQEENESSSLASEDITDTEIIRDEQDYID